MYETMPKSVSLTRLLQDFVDGRYKDLMFAGEDASIEEIFIDNTLKFMLNSSEKFIYIDKIHGLIIKNFYIDMEKIFEIIKEYYMVKNKQKNRQILMNYVKEFSNYDICAISKITLSEDLLRALLASTILSLHNALAKNNTYVDLDTLDIIYYSTLKGRLCDHCINIIREKSLEYTELSSIKSKYILFLSKYTRNLEKIKGNIVYVFYDVVKRNMDKRYRMRKEPDKVIILLPDKTVETTTKKFLTDQI